MVAATKSTPHRFAGLDLLATLVLITDVSGQVLYTNPALENALSLSWRQIVGQPAASLFAHSTPVQDAIAAAAQLDFSSLRFEAQLLRPHQDPLAVHLVLCASDTANEVILEMQTLEQQSRHERELRLTEQAQANKELIRNLAHEIKNPLGGIRGAAQLLQMELTNASLHEYTDVIVKEADRLQSLVDRLLAPHRRISQRASVNIHEVCEHVCNVIQAQYPIGLRLHREYDVSIPDLKADPEQLLQALLNLMSNAAQAVQGRMTDGSAHITVRTRIERQVTVGQNRHKLALILHVIDNGSGVPESIKERLFHPMVTGRADGTGLGLTLAQSFVTQHEGLIEFDSRPGLTDFKIVLPLHVA